MSRRIMVKIMILLVAALIVLGCVSPLLATPPPPSDQNLGKIETLVVQTAQAAQTATAFHLPPSATPTQTRPPTSTPTTTPTPTSTVIFTFYTQTPVSLSSPVGNGGGSSDPSQSQWACTILSRSPANGTVFKPKEKFTAIWSLRNTGYSTWGVNAIDYRFLGGADMSKRNLFDFPRSVPSGGTISIVVNMTAPNRSGFYSTRWTLRVGNTNFCAMKISIEVK